MKLIIVKPIMTEPRFHFDRTLELSKYIDIVWICGWMLYDHYSFDNYQAKNHQIIALEKGRMRGKFKGLYDEYKFIKKAVNQIKNEDPDIVLIHSSRLAFFYPILAPKFNYILQLFTTSVSTSKLKNWFWDSWERLVMLPYKRYFVGTSEMIELFKINKKKKTYVTRWGMKSLSSLPKVFTSIKLLYIGVLGPSRRIEDTLRGLRLFLNRNPDMIISYDVIGRAKPEEMQEFKNAIMEYKLENIVTYHGYLPDEDIVKFFDECNVGVSYVPITPYYTDVIVTKTAEYMLSGLATIATNTNKNREMISEINGVLINDTAESFAQGLEEIHRKLSTFDSQKIRKSAKEWDLAYNIEHDIIPLLKKIAKNPKEY